MGIELTGLAGKVAVVTGAGRMRSIGRAIAIELARAGCHVVITGTGRTPEHYTDQEKAAGWRDIESVADEVRALGRRSTPVVVDVSDDQAVEDLASKEDHPGAGRQGRHPVVQPAARRSRFPE